MIERTDHTDAAAQRLAPRPVLGIGAMLGTTLIIPLMGLCVKLLHEYRIGVIEILTVRSWLVLLLLLPALALAANARALRRAHKPAHLWHAVFGLSAMACFYAAFAQLPLVTVTAINFTTPMFLSLLAIPMLGERPDGPSWIAIAVGFVGALIILRPTGGVFDIFVLVVLAGSFLTACMLIAVRRMPAVSTTFAVLFFYAAVGSVAFGLLFAVSGGSQAVEALSEGATWPLLIALSLLALALQFLLTLAYRLASSTAVAGLDYLRLFWAGVIGWLVFAELPDRWDVAGMTLIIVSGLAILIRQARARAPATGAV
ncbi:MAG: DMT family transporter [Inquilinaceae bacterium]